MIKTGAKEAYEYQRLTKKHTPRKPFLKNSVRAFLAGGTICLLGQVIQSFFMRFGFNERTAANPTVATLIFISVLLTGFGVYDRFAQWAGAGSAVPVTGFANAMASAALEYKSEGYVLGVGGNMFKVSGPVIVFGVTAAFVVALVRKLFEMI
ncbi:stage V sporulation protein AC [Collibacillus ludicampi]|jgi:stage V sporulation protein AC|uniref:Stage V sporulation protein AC n=1 Tax=Collibacillus ludicampi TaxID=2771369 RepID=A0AAV4LL33_9BACL|nr:stage V sporulation protein AC [Collibacillus ludicampi]GIM48283.1 stage V sporulation protein AC [Collibacillus ludicampi]